MKDIDPESIAYANDVVKFYDDPENLGKLPPEPPSVEVAFDYAATIAQCLGAILDVFRLGSPLASPLNPTVESRLQVAELLDVFMDRYQEHGEEVAMAEMAETLRGIFEGNQ